MPDAEYKRTMMLKNQGLVRSIASIVAGTIGKKADLDDLIAYGQVGLAEAVDEFNPERGVQFSTYSYYRIRGAILDGAYQMSWYNRSQIRRMKFESLAFQSLQQSQDCPPLESAQASVSRMVVIGLAMDVGELSKNAANSKSGDEQTPEADAIRDEAFEQLRDAITHLPSRERDLVEAIYFDGLSLADYSRKHGEQRYWATRIHNQAIEQLGNSLRGSSTTQEA